jgi:hypothetical protein
MAKHAGFLAVLLLCACVLGGCEDYTFQFGACDGPNPAPPPDCPEVEPGCTGQCLPLAPFGWSVPALLWVGPELMAPECPADRAKVVAYEGHADLKPPQCFGCSCKAPTGTCERPTMMTAYADQGCSVTVDDFSAPDPWDGSCDVAAAPLDDVLSVLVEPVTMFESECEPEQHDVPRDGSPTWGTFARACLGNGFTTPCPDPSDYCAPTSEPPPEGFSQCVYHDGDQVCPPGYPNKQVFYNSATDQRVCADCTCGDPQGGVCSMRMDLYQGNTCSMDFPNHIGMYPVDSTASICLPFIGGMTLQSKSAEPLAYTPGICEPRGGEPVGPVELVGPSTFCCQDD